MAPRNYAHVGDFGDPCRPLMCQDMREFMPATYSLSSLLMDA